VNPSGHQVLKRPTIAFSCSAKFRRLPAFSFTWMLPAAISPAVWFTSDMDRAMVISRPVRN